MGFLDPEKPGHELILIELVKKHCQIFGDAAFGAGHVVLADYNWGSIDFCLNEIKKYREGKGGDMQVYYDDPADMFGFDHDATEQFLLYLKCLIE